MPGELNLLYQQLDLLTGKMAKMEGNANVIDPVEYGELRGAVSALTTRVNTMDAKLDEVLSRLSEAKGGWRALMLLGGAAATFGAVVSWLFDHVHVALKGLG